MQYGDVHAHAQNGTADYGDGHHDNMHPQWDAEEAEEEERALQRILSAFRAYEVKLGWEVARWRHNYERLPPRHKALLPDEPAKHQAALQCIRANQQVINAMLDVFEADRGVPRSSAGVAAVGGPSMRDVAAVSSADIDKVKYVFKNLMRDWSAEGAAERAQSYGRLLAELRARLPPPPAPPEGGDGLSLPPPPRVLVPGAGQGRLCLEAAIQGFEAEGCEHSWFMLISSAFMLNGADAAHQFTVHPWVHSVNNQPSAAAQLRGVSIPDLAAAEAPLRPGLLSMCAGDFLEVYGGSTSRGQFDAVLTCFFLDTAHNVLEYIEVLYRILKPGGFWINLGPLLWHWSDSHLYMGSDELSIELPLDDVLRIAAAAGFVTLQRQSVETAYTTDTRSMMRTVYDSQFWTMQKPAAAAGNALSPADADASPPAVAVTSANGST